MQIAYRRTGSRGKAENLTQPWGPSMTFSFVLPAWHPVLLSVAGITECVYALGSWDFFLCVWLLVLKNR